MNFIGLLMSCLFLTLCACQEDDCNRRPLGTKTMPLPPDERFEIEVVDVEDDKYIPKKEYTVRLSSRDQQATFIAFTIFLTPDQRPHDKNKLRTYDLDPGQLLNPRSGVQDTMAKNMCPNTLFQADIHPKTSVEALWIAPPKGNNCVTIKAYLAIRPDLWYDAESPLAKKLCEDERKAEDLQPKINHNCTVCEEARYELTFEGTWSFNTHPKMFPENKELAKFSDIVGASHSKDFYVFKNNADASLGLQVMAEQGNTTDLEIDILKELGQNVRTLIKATAPPKPDMSTVTSFRATREMHLVSIVTSIMPSPDWFVGVANLEVCDADTGTWAKSVRLNLYPFDAGTDSGKDFESSNEVTLPHQPITSADIMKRVDKDYWKPFAVLKVDLVRTYVTPDCLASTTTTEPSYSYTRAPDSDTPEPPTVFPTDTPYTPDTEETEDNKCDMTPWTDWSSCDGDCVDSVRTGFRARYRSFKESLRGKALEDCLQERTSDFEECEEPCGEPTTTTEVPVLENEDAEKRRIWRQQLLSRSLN